MANAGLAFRATHGLDIVLCMELFDRISVPARRINEIVHGRRSVSADTALRLSRFFGTSERFWMNLQIRYDLEVEKDRLGPRLDREVQSLREAG